MNLGNGTALLVDSPDMVELHGALAERFHGLLGWQDDRELRLHITIQNKVETALAKALQKEMRATLDERRFRFRGLGLYAWEEGLWRSIADYSFRG